jgi:[ribosomal protein S5]-alanine N-acetyltransferase
MPVFWGRGLASEMAAALLRHGADRLGPRGIVAFTLTTNGASRRVMEKLGFRLERDITYAWLPHVLYRLGAPASSRSGPPPARHRGG